MTAITSGAFPARIITVARFASGGTLRDSEAFSSVADARHSLARRLCAMRGDNGTLRLTRKGGAHAFDYHDNGEAGGRLRLRLVTRYPLLRLTVARRAAIGAIVDALEAQSAARGCDPIGAETRAELVEQLADDATAWDILDDFEARLGLDVADARADLVAVYQAAGVLS